MRDIDRVYEVDAAVKREWPKLLIPVERLLTDEWARDILRRIEAGDRLRDFGAASDWRRLVSIADVKGALEMPDQLGWVALSVTAPVIVAARKILISGTPLDAEGEKLLEDGVFPSVLYEPALNHTSFLSSKLRPDEFIRYYYLHRRWYLSTILPAWADYAKNEDISAVTKIIEAEMEKRGDILYGEAAERADDLLAPYHVHHGVAAGLNDMFVVPHAMDREGVDVRDIAAMKAAISKAPHWQRMFKEYLR